VNATEKTRRPILYYFTGILLALSSILLASCKNDMQTINSLTQIDSLPMEFGRDIEVTYSDSGKVKVLLKSPLMVRVEDKDPYFEFPEGFDATFYDSAMNPESRITADYGISYEQKKLMEAKNNVVVKNLVKHEQLNTEHLIWDRRKGIIYSNVFVKITKPDEVIYGDGLTSDQNFNFYEIDNPTGEFAVYPNGQDSVPE
jgi:LPS export ABC transporter protein LptC